MTATWTNEELREIVSNGETEREQELARTILEMRGEQVEE